MEHLLSRGIGEPLALVAVKLRSLAGRVKRFAHARL
jgi:hypothetical protein